MYLIISTRDNFVKKIMARFLKKHFKEETSSFQIV